MQRTLLFFGLILASANLAAAEQPAVELLPGDHKIDVKIAGRFFTSYLYPDSLPKQILYPVHTPAGGLVSRGFPIKPAPGESNDHPHHTGIFFAYDQVNGNNFWLNTARSPRIEQVKILARESGREGRLRTVHHWVGKDGKVLLEETRETVFRGGKDAFIVDWQSDLVAVADKVKFGDTKEGMLALRTADWMREDFQKKSGVIGISGSGNGKYSNALGDERESGVWGKRSPWVSLAAVKDGKPVGVAIFNHPSSVNYPTYWHARGYGLFAANPLGQGAFEAVRNPSKGKNLGLTLERGQKAHFQFRVLVYDGVRSRDDLEHVFKEFAR